MMTAAARPTRMIARVANRRRSSGVRGCRRRRRYSRTRARWSGEDIPPSLAPSVTSQRVVTGDLLGREDPPGRQVRLQVRGAQTGLERSDLRSQPGERLLVDRAGRESRVQSLLLLEDLRSE